MHTVPKPPWLIILFVLLLWLPINATKAGNPRIDSVDIYVFWQIGCPHCAFEKDFLVRLMAEEPRIRVHELEISQSPANQAVFRSIWRK